MESVYPKINELLWLCSMKKKITIILNIKRRKRCRSKTNFRTRKNPTGEFVIVAKLGDLVSLYPFECD